MEDRAVPTPPLSLASVPFQGLDILPISLGRDKEGRPDLAPLSLSYQTSKIL